MPTMQGTVTSLARPRNVAPVRVPQEPWACGYSTQTAYHNGKPASRFPVASQVSQRPQQYNGLNKIVSVVVVNIKVENSSNTTQD